MSRGAIPILRIGNTLLASIQVELRDTVADAFQEDLLGAIERSGASGLLIDISALDVVDTYVARTLAETGRMAKLMGARTVLVGMRPEVAATLVRMGYTMEGVKTALNIEQGLSILGQAHALCVQILATQAMTISCEDDVVLVRRRVRELAQKHGLDAFASAAITTATSELSRNIWVHARGGTATIQEISDGRRAGLNIVFADTGPGIADLERALAGGHSTARSLGLGLSGSRRLVDEFRIDTVVGRGTSITVVKWARF